MLIHSIRIFHVEGLCNAIIIKISKTWIWSKRICRDQHAIPVLSYIYSINLYNTEELTTLKYPIATVIRFLMSHFGWLLLILQSEML